MKALVTGAGGFVAGTLVRQLRARAGVTYWFSDARTRSELGYAPRDLDAGLRTLLST